MLPFILGLIDPFHSLLQLLIYSLMHAWEGIQFMRDALSLMVGWVWCFDVFLVVWLFACLFVCLIDCLIVASSLLACYSVCFSNGLFVTYSEFA